MPAADTEADRIYESDAETEGIRTGGAEGLCRPDGEAL